MSLLVPHAPQAQGGKGSGCQRGQEETSRWRPSAMSGVCRGKACTMWRVLGHHGQFLSCQSPSLACR